MSLLLIRRIVIPGMNLIDENINLLTELDSNTGDGDHGVTMGKISALIKKRLRELADDTELSEALDDLSWDIMNINGGSAGPLWGAFFEGMGIGASMKYKDDKELIINMLIEGYKNFYSLSKAQPGQKTMIDAIYPATEVLKTQTNINIQDLALIMAELAEKGAEDTAGMIASYGRAKSLKEKSIGHKDPGAVSFSLFYRGIAQGLNQ